MLSMHQIRRSKDINLTTKCRLIQAIVFPISTYGCESWTVKKLIEGLLMPLSCGVGESSQGYYGP